MNKLFMKVATLSIGLAMAIGVGVAVGSNAKGTKTAVADGDTATDVLTRSLIGVTGTSYSGWSGITSESNAVYAGNSAGEATVNKVKVQSIQLRSSGNSGIVSTTSGGKVKSVTVAWHNKTTSGRTINVYGKNTAYSSSADLYGDNAGTLIGSIVYGTSTSLTINDDYDYIGLRSASSAQYLTSINIVWEVPTDFCTVEFNSNGGSNVSDAQVAKGGTVSIPADPTKSNYEFDGWYTDNGTFESPFDFTSAINNDIELFAKWISASSYVKVTSEPADWSGEYVLVYEDSNSGDAFIWTGVDDNFCYAQKAISNNSVKIDEGGAPLTISKIDQSVDYSIRIKKGVNKNKYIGGLVADSNGMQFSDSVIANSLSYNSSNTSITSNSKYFTFYSDANTGRFRYFKTANQSVQLYKKYVAYIVSYDANGGGGEMADTETTVAACSFTAPSGKEFDHWNTAADDSGDTFAVGASVSADTELYAIWRNLTPAVTLSAESLSVTVGGSSASLTATSTNITNPSFAWERTAGEDYVTFSGSTSAGVNTLTVSAKSGARVSSVTLTLTVSGTLGGNPITPIVKTVTVLTNRVSSSGDPFTVAEAKLSIDRGVNLSDAYVEGIVSQVDSFSSQYSSITYWISSDGTTTNQLEAYSGKGIGGADFSNISDVLVGAEVVIKGTLKLYNEVYQFNYNNELVTYTPPAVTTYRVTYSAEDKTGGSVPTDSTNYESGATVTVKGNPGNLEKTGYTFAGWTDGEETYQENETFSMPASNVTLSAVWEEIPPAPSRDYEFYGLNNTDAVTAGVYIIAAHTESGYFGMTRTGGSKPAFSDKLTVSNNNKIAYAEGNALEFEISILENGFAIKNLSTGYYVKYSSSTNLGEQENAYAWSIGSGTNGTFRIGSVASSGRGIIARAGSTEAFGGYATSNVTPTSTEYYDVELFKAYRADDLAAHVTSNITCTQGASKPSFVTGYSWSVLNGEWDKLTTAEKNILINAKYTRTGSGTSTVITPVDGTDQAIANGVAKYDYIVGRYYKTGIDTSFTDFMGRNPDPIGSGRINLGDIVTSTGSTTLIIIVVSLVGASAIGGYYLFRKKKQN